MEQQLVASARQRLFDIIHAAPPTTVAMVESMAFGDERKYLTVNMDPAKFKTVELSMITDVQFGHVCCNVPRFVEYRDWILDKPNRFCFFGGDLIDAATKLSVGDPHDNTWIPSEQALRFAEIAMPLRPRILGYVGGNHERRSAQTWGSADKTIANLMGIPYSSGKQIIDIHYGDHAPFQVALWHGTGGARTKGAKAQMLHRFMQEGSNTRLYLCFGPDTPVLMADGIQKAISQVQVGDKVMTGTGYVASVRHKWATIYRGDTCQIQSLQGQLPILCTPSHRLQVYDNGIKFQEAGELSKKALWVQGSFDNFPTEPANVSLGTMRLYGYYLAEGCVWHSKDGRCHQLSFCFGADEADTLVPDCLALLESLGYHGKIKKQSNNSVIVRCCEQEAVAHFETLFGKGSANVCLPTVFLYYPLEHVRELVEGLFLGDGYQRGNFRKLEITSARLAQQTRFLLLRLGLVPSRLLTRHRPSRKTTYSIGYTTKPLGAKGRRTRVLPNSRLASPFHPTKIIKDYNGLVYNLTLDGPDSTYVVDGHVVSNCGHLHDVVLLFDWKQVARKGRIDLVKVAGVMSSSFLDFFGTYAEVAGLPPTSTMMARCILEPNGKWEVTLR